MYIICIKYVPLQPQEENIPSLQHIDMDYIIKTFRGKSVAKHYSDAFLIAQDQLAIIKAEGFGLSKQWVRIEYGVEMAKVLYPLPDGTTNVSPWFSIF